MNFLIVITTRKNKINLPNSVNCLHESHLETQTMQLLIGRVKYTTNRSERIPIHCTACGVYCGVGKS